MSLLAQGSAGGGLTLLASYAGDGTTASADFSSIPSNYKDLVIIATGRTAAASPLDTLSLKANNLATNIYDRQRIFDTNLTTLSTDSSLAQASLGVGLMAGNTAAAGQAATCQIEIFDYAGTTFEKTVLASNVAVFDTGHGLYMIQTAGNIRITAAINQVTLSTVSNLAAGSKIHLYGRR